MAFHLEACEAAIAPLLGALSFIPDPRRRGFPFRRGHFEVPIADMARIAAAMGIAFEPAAGSRLEGRSPPPRRPGRRPPR